MCFALPEDITFSLILRAEVFPFGFIALEYRYCLNCFSKEGVVVGSYLHGSTVVGK